jgi:hypothetical protein
MSVTKIQARQLTTFAPGGVHCVAGGAGTYRTAPNKRLARGQARERVKRLIFSLITLGRKSI